MRLDEVKKFTSTVYNILEKTVDKGVEVNIDLELTPGVSSEFKGVKYGEIIETVYWSTENIVNIIYMLEDQEGNRRQRNWRYRPISGVGFDEEFTLKKIDGVLTFTAREKRDD